MLQKDLAAGAVIAVTLLFLNAQFNNIALRRTLLLLLLVLMLFLFIFHVRLRFWFQTGTFTAVIAAVNLIRYVYLDYGFRLRT